VHSVSNEERRWRLCISVVQFYQSNHWRALQGSPLSSLRSSIRTRPFGAKPNSLPGVVILAGLPPYHLNFSDHHVHTVFCSLPKFNVRIFVTYLVFNLSIFLSTTSAACNTRKDLARITNNRATPRSFQ
jgi:hypothetical protein